MKHHPLELFGNPYRERFQLPPAWGIRCNLQLGDSVVSMLGLIFRASTFFEWFCLIFRMFLMDSFFLLTNLYLKRSPLPEIRPHFIIFMNVPIPPDLELLMLDMSILFELGPYCEYHQPSQDFRSTPSLYYSNVHQSVVGCDSMIHT